MSDQTGVAPQAPAEPDPADLENFCNAIRMRFQADLARYKVAFDKFQAVPGEGVEFTFTKFDELAGPLEAARRMLWRTLALRFLYSLPGEVIEEIETQYNT